MRKVRCPICEKKTYFTDRQYLISHIAKKHKEHIPDGWEASRYENFLRTGKTHGTCMVCKKDTGWNTTTNKYYRLCNNPACKKALAQKAEENMVKKTGMTKSERMKQADVQTKMIYGKHTSGCYKVGNHEIWYDSSYGKEFVELLDVFLNLDMNDVSGPSTNTYTYMYEGKPHMYIPDFRMQSLNLEVEIKDGGDNPNNHPKIQAVDKKKEEEKDKVMAKLQKEGKVRYIKIVNKDYREFFKLLMELREQYDGDVTSKPVSDETSDILEEGAEHTMTAVSKDVKMYKGVLNMHNKARGNTSSYKQIPIFYLETIRKMKPKDVQYIEYNIDKTIQTLKTKYDEIDYNVKSGKEYELEDAIDQMEHVVVPEFNKRVEILRRREATS